MAGSNPKKKLRRKPRWGFVCVVVGSFLWVVVSIILLDIAVEQFQNDEDYTKLGYWSVAVILGYVVVLYTIGVRRKKRKEAEKIAAADDSS